MTLTRLTPVGSGVEVGYGTGVSRAMREMIRSTTRAEVAVGRGVGASVGSLRASSAIGGAAATGVAVDELEGRLLPIASAPKTITASASSARISQVNMWSGDGG